VPSCGQRQGRLARTTRAGDRVEAMLVEHRHQLGELLMAADE
jgi:hypothetical protein